MLTIFDTKKSKLQKSHLKNLIALAKADGKISDSEKEYIFKVAEKHGLKSAEVESMLIESSNEDVRIPSNDSERFDQIFDLVQMMLADGSIDDNEMDFCIVMAEKLGFRKAIVGILVRKISIGLTSGLDKDAIRKESEN
ncbi:MAG: TerB family tellurite resistance protein, partial [Cytophagaceae bacterium]